MSDFRVDAVTDEHHVQLMQMSLRAVEYARRLANSQNDLNVANSLIVSKDAEIANLKALLLKTSEDAVIPSEE